MNIEAVGQEISDTIDQWRTDGVSVIGIDGYSGAGKTTLLKFLAERNSFITPVFMDDFVSTANTKETLEPQVAEHAQELKLQWAPADGLEKLSKTISDFRLGNTERKVLVIEGIFLFHPEVLRNVLDKIIYLNVDKEDADARRVAREQARWGENYFPETHPDSFVGLFIIAYKKYEELYDPKHHADFVLHV